MLMTAEAYRDSLRAYRPTVYVDGLKVDSVVDEPQRRDLPLVLVAVVAARDEHGGAVAVRDRRDRDEAVRPAAGVRDLRVLEAPDLLAGRREVDRAGDRRLRHTRAASTAETAASP